MVHFTACRLSQSIRNTPDEVTIDETGITVNIPRMLGTLTKTLPYGDISSVAVHNPVLGFCSVTIRTFHRDLITTTGYTTDVAYEIRRLVTSGIQRCKTSRWQGTTARHLHDDAIWSFSQFALRLRRTIKDVQSFLAHNASLIVLVAILLAAVLWAAL